MLFWQRLGTAVFFINISSALGFRSLSNWQKSFICNYGIIKVNSMIIIPCLN